MKSKDKVTLMIFIALIVAIIGVFLINLNKNKPLENIDRKVEYIFNTYTYDSIYKTGSNLFFQVIELLNNKSVFEYEKDSNGSIKFFSINDYNQYRKITNYNLVTNTLVSAEVTKFMELKKIIQYEQDYYIEFNTESVNNNYVGSILDIDYYDNSYVYFKSTNYYCDNYKYVGTLTKEPTCNYIKTETTFRIEKENNNLRISSLEEIKSILN